MEAVRAGDRPPAPLVLRAAVGDCIEVTLENLLPPGSTPVVLHADGLAYDPADSGGIEAGTNPSQSVAVGATRTYTFFAHPEYGTGAAMLRDGADIAHSALRGLYGAIAVAPEEATFDDATSWSTVVRTPDGKAWRDVVLFMHDTDDAIGTHRMPYTTAVRGAVGLNYGRGETGPVIEAYTGDPMELHVLAPWSEQVQVFSLEGHRWPREPDMDGATHVASIAIGGLESITVIPDGGAGGESGLAGTYELGDHREPYREAGLSGRLVVHDPSTAVAGLEPLTPPADPSEPTASTSRPEVTTSESSSPDDGAPPNDSSTSVALLAVGAAGLGAGAVAMGMRARRRRHR